MSHKTVLITGATSGIGRLAAEKFAQEGYGVIIHGRSDDKIEAAINEIRAACPKAPKITGLKADLSSAAEAKGLVKAVQDLIPSQHPSLDVLINNAGIGPNHQQIFEVNYIATVLIAEGLLPQLKAAGGRIINIASEAQAPVQLPSFPTATGMSAYAQSKLAVIQYSMLLAEREPSVTVAALDPGSFLATKMVKETWGHDGRDINIGVNAQFTLATDPSLKTGQFFCEGRPATAHADAYDKALQQKLWEFTASYL